MNQDFFIPASGGLARRIMALSAISNIVVEPELVELAKTDLIDDNVLQAQKLIVQQRKAAQAIYDCNFRALVPSSDPESSIATILVLAKMYELFPVFVVSPRIRWWKILATEFDFPKEHLRTVEFRTTATGMDADAFKNGRHGLFVADELMGSDRWHKIGHHAFDFSKTIFMTENQDFTTMYTPVSFLFPKAPLELLGNKSAMVARRLENMGFNEKFMSPEGYRVMFNIVTDLMVREQPQL